MTLYTFRKSNTSKGMPAKSCLVSPRHSRIGLEEFDPVLINHEPESLQDENIDTYGALGVGNPSGLILVLSSRENLQKDLCERESIAAEFDAMWKVVLTR
ncbi:hypothetical protein TNCV_3159041 [Trichonephila clavipes]|nr:hypothetical protein TNCV_3159041 [Trichonephila clavipes]